jgi:starch synthase (maltosyl-transferring)
LRVEGGNRRVIIEGVTPEIDGGRFAAKRVLGDRVAVEADIFADGHDVIAAQLHVTAPDGTHQSIHMEPLPNDRWRGEFEASQLGIYRFTLEGWVDHYRGWRRDLRKRIDAGEDVQVQLQIGAAMLRSRAERAGERDRILLGTLADSLMTEAITPAEALARVEELAALADRHTDRSLATRYDHEVPLQVDIPRARFSSWYELFPRSLGANGKHGTLRDVIKHLPYVTELGFDVLYLPPIHPIGDAHRKGKNNAPSAEAGDVGSPWAVGGTAGGHKSIHPDLGSDEDFDALVAAAKKAQIDIALDIAFQASPDHPLVKEHPEFFLWRPDNTVQYAENPPKKYQDIYPFHFESEAWQELWQELRSIFEHWIRRGVRIFRVDNPHTKPFAFWEWTITSLKEQHPDLIFLAEAFTRPKIMYRLAKLGFTQSYTYFTWRNNKQELTEYFTELTQTDVRETFRPNLWPNTPDILHEYLQTGGRPAFIARLILAATLGADYGMYAPAFELLQHVPREPKSEEYLHSEKYEIREWQLERPDSLRPLIAQVNRIRREHAALQSDWSLRFHRTDNEYLLAYSKHDEASRDWLLVVVNLNPSAAQSGWLELDLAEFALPSGSPFPVVDLLSGTQFVWQGARQPIMLDPAVLPAHVLHFPR